MTFTRLVAAAALVAASFSITPIVATAQASTGVSSADQIQTVTPSTVEREPSSGGGRGRGGGRHGGHHGAGHP